MSSSPFISKIRNNTAACERQTAKEVKTTSASGHGVDEVKPAPSQVNIAYGQAARASEQQLVVARDQGTATLADGSKFALVAPNKSGKMHDPQDLVQLAKFVQDSDNYTTTSAHGKLRQISDQIKYLQGQAVNTLRKAKRDAQLNHASCNFKRRPGKIYHLYEKEDGIPFFSMLSPQEWGANHPHTYLDSYRLEYDMSWTELEHIQEHDRNQVLDPNLLGFNNMPGENGNPFMLTI